MRKITLLLVTVIVLLRLSSCKSPDIKCEPCASKGKTTINGFYRYLLTNKGLQLIQYDSATGNSSSGISICTNKFQIEDTKIIFINGTYVKVCNSNDSIVKIESYRIIDSCVGTIPNLTGTYPLLETQWKIEYLTDNGAMILPPCEGESLTYFRSTGQIDGIITKNFFSSSYSTSIDEIQIGNSITFGLLVGTDAQVSFERSFAKIISANATLKFSIQNNRLTIRNELNNDIIKFYTK